MSASTIPYIGSKISLISNSEIRYEGILYTINTQESTIALQSVKTFGTEGRKMPEIPPSSEIYDFIIFRGQDIKDLTVLEGAQNSSSPMYQDPAIMSMNQRPAGGPGKDGNKGKGKGSFDKGAARPEKGGGSAWDKGGGKEMSGYWQGGGKSDGWGKGSGKWDDGKGRGKSDGWSGSYFGGGGYGKSGKGDYGKDYGKGGKDYGKGDKGGKSFMKGGKDAQKGYSQKGSSKGGGGKNSKGDGKDKGGSRSGGKAGKGLTAQGVPVGELLPEMNSDAKKEFAEEFDLSAAATKFDKVTDAEEKKPLSGYSKVSSFFDNISCEATDRAEEADRPRVDREKARAFDKETFGDTSRPPRPAGVRRGKGKGKGGGK